jgi:hypothetical protein
MRLRLSVKGRENIIFESLSFLLHDRRMTVCLHELVNEEPSLLTTVYIRQLNEKTVLPFIMQHPIGCDKTKDMNRPPFSLRRQAHTTLQFLHPMPFPGVPLL